MPNTDDDNEELKAAKAEWLRRLVAEPLPTRTVEHTVLSGSDVYIREEEVPAETPHGRRRGYTFGRGRTHDYS